MTDSDGMFSLTMANTPWARLRGLMFRESLGRNEGMLLTPCNGIHTFFMRFDIDVIFLNRKMEVVALHERLRPNSFGVMCFGAGAVLECPAGFISSHRIRPNQVLELLSGAGVPHGAPHGAPHGEAAGRIPARFV